MKASTVPIAISAIVTAPPSTRDPSPEDPENAPETEERTSSRLNGSERSAHRVS